MRWRALPGSLDPECRLLIIRLRRMKDRSGLSLKSLAAKTPFSASSWERYLNGKTLPPETAVRALAAMAGTDPLPSVALYAAAERTWPGESEPAPPEAGEQRIRVVPLSVAAGSLLLSALTAVVLIIGPGGGPPTTARAGVAGVGQYTCTFSRRGDLMFAGASATSSRLLMRNSTGPDVAEVQCLLQRHRLPTGDVDGYLGESTEAAIKRLQQRDHVPADGVVSDQTWTLLRHVD